MTFTVKYFAAALVEIYLLKKSTSWTCSLGASGAGRKAVSATVLMISYAN